MAAIYQADVWCDDCADSIKDRLWAESEDGATFSHRVDWEESVGYDDERSYDSGEYPKDCDDAEECDCPQHCAAGLGCINAEAIDDDFKVGYFFGNSLTTDGEDYVREAVTEDVAAGCVDSVACLIWMPYYDWIDYDGIGTCEGCGDLAACDSEGFCVVCAEKVPTMTDVVFLREFDGDDVFALFPAHAACVGRTDLMVCYAHAGQHGSASYDYCNLCAEVTDADEYSDLFDELQRAGYDLYVISKDRYNDAEYADSRRQEAG